MPDSAGPFVQYPRHEALPSFYHGQRSSLEFRKLAPHLAAEVTGIDLHRPLTDDEVADLSGAWVVHGVLVLRQSVLSPASLVEFTQRFGKLVAHPAGRFSLEGNPTITVLSNQKDADARNVGADRSGMQWHSDQSFRQAPALGTFLYGVTCPPEGAATEFCSTYAAYDSLTLEERQLLLRLNGVHDYGWYWNTYQPNRSPLTTEEAGPPVTHPAICTHPVTHRNVIYLSEGVTRTIEGMREEEGRALVLKYSDFCGQDRFRYAHVWSDGDLVMWDNLAVMHRATDFDNKYVRYMLRTQVQGGIPRLVAPNA